MAVSQGDPLIHEEEQELVDNVITCSNIEKRDEVIGNVCKTLQNKKGDLVEKFNGKGWWLHFMECWPKLALCKGDAATSQCYDGNKRSWIRCTNTDTCGLWMHCECLNKAPSGT